MIYNHDWPRTRQRWLTLAMLVTCAGIICTPVYGVTRSLSGCTPSAALSPPPPPPPPPPAAAAAKRPSADKPEKQLLPTVDGIPPGSTAETLPGNLPAAGLIDPESAQNSGAPGVLTPLAQASFDVSHWIDAVDAAGAAVPLADPMFKGTLFVPDDKAFEESYPALRTTDAVDVFSDVRPSHLAAQLNRLTAPGAALRLDQLSPGQVLTSADDEVLQVMEVSAAEGRAKLQQIPSGAVLTVIEANIQSGDAIAHVVDVLPPPPPSAATALERAAADDKREPGGRYKSAMTVLLDPVQELGEFAALVEQAQLSDLLSEEDTELTLFAPSNEAIQQFLHDIAPSSRDALAANITLVDELVSAHLVSGVSLGTKALEALSPPGQMESQAGSLLTVQQQQGAQSPSEAAEGQVVTEAAAAVRTATTKLTVDGAALLYPDIAAGRAVVHIIDKVLVPPHVAQQLHVPTTTLGPLSDGRDVHGAATSAAVKPQCAARPLLGFALAIAVVAAQV